MADVPLGSLNSEKGLIIEGGESSCEQLESYLKWYRFLWIFLTFIFTFIYFIAASNPGSAPPTSALPNVKITHPFPVCYPSLHIPGHIIWTQTGATQYWGGRVIKY